MGRENRAAGGVGGGVEIPDACGRPRTTAGPAPARSSLASLSGAQPRPCALDPSTRSHFDPGFGCSPELRPPLCPRSPFLTSSPAQPRPAALSQAGGVHGEGEEHAGSGEERVGRAARFHLPPRRILHRAPASAYWAGARAAGAPPLRRGPSPAARRRPPEMDPKPRPQDTQPEPGPAPAARPRPWGPRPREAGHPPPLTLCSPPDSPEPHPQVSGA